MLKRRNQWTRIGLGLGLALGHVATWLSAQATSGDQDLAELPEDLRALLTKSPEWSQSVTVSAGIGHKDNLLLSSVNPESSGFARGVAEVFLLRAPEAGHDFSAFLSTDGTRFFAAKSVDHEAQLFLHTEWRYRPDEKLRLSLAGQGYYLDQVFDVSDTEAQRVVAQMKVIGVAAVPTVRWSPVAWLWGEGRAALKREVFDDGSNDSRVAEAEGRVGWKPADRLEVSAGLLARRRTFDRREQYSAGGRPFPGTVLQVFEREADFRAKVALGSAGNWKLTSRAAVLRYEDNGEGFFNYGEHKLAEGLEWSAGNWTMQLDGSARRLVYAVQTVGLGAEVPPRLKEAFGAELRLERKLNERWKIFGEYRWERSRANDGLSGYRINEGLIGMQWSWES